MRGYVSYSYLPILSKPRSLSLLLTFKNSFFLTGSVGGVVHLLRKCSAFQSTNNALSYFPIMGKYRSGVGGKLTTKIAHKKVENCKNNTTHSISGSLKETLRDRSLFTGNTGCKKGIHTGLWKFSTSIVRGLKK